MICKLKVNKNDNRCNDNLTILLTSLSDKQKVYEDESLTFNDLRKSDIEILKILSGNQNENMISTFSFNGLKIRLNLHQEILSRSLKRLKELGLIEKTKSGYKATKNGKTIFSKLNNILNKNQTAHRENTQILQLSVPFKIINQQLIEHLSGKWFNNLRWIGMTQNVTGYQLKWKDIENFIEIVVHISDNNIIIETNDSSSSNISKAFSYSTKILGWISDIVTKENLLIYPINKGDFNSITN